MKMNIVNKAEIMTMRRAINIIQVIVRPAIFRIETISIPYCSSEVVVRREDMSAPGEV